MKCCERIRSYFLKIQMIVLILYKLAAEKMTVKLNKSVAILLGCICLMSCIYDYNPKDESLPGLMEPHFVIDGDIIVGGVTRIRLGFTETLLDETKDLPAGITVAVESEEGVYVQGTLADDGVNVFEIDTKDLKTDGSYRLCVSVPGRGEYISEFKRVVLTPPIDTITWTMSHDSTYVDIEVSTHTYGDETLYCKWNYDENWESSAYYPPNLKYDRKTERLIDLTEEEKTERSYCWSEAHSSYVLIADTERLKDNIISKFVVNKIAPTDTRVRGLYSINIVQRALDKEAYSYWAELQRNMQSTGGIFSAQPTELKGNIVSLSNPSEEVIGYVSVTTTTEKRVFIDWSEIKFFSTGCSLNLIDAGDKIMMTNYYRQGYVPVSYSEALGEKVKAFWTVLQCADCRSYSNSTKPDFWPR